MIETNKMYPPFLYDLIKAINTLELRVNALEKKPVGDIASMSEALKNATNEIQQIKTDIKPLLDINLEEIPLVEDPITDQVPTS